MILKDPVRKALPDGYDLFGIHRTIQRLVKKRPWWYSIGAKLIDWAILLIALLPLVLLLVSSVLVLMPDVSMGKKLAAGAFLLWGGLFLTHQLRLLDTSEGASMQPTSQHPGRCGSVIVIGAGPVGLAVVKECLALGLDVQCFERQDGVGGVFRPNRQFPGGCWPTVKLTSSPWITAYSDFPPDSSSCRHQTAQEYVKYLERYVRHFGLQDCLHFRQMVTTVQPDEAGGWYVTLVDRDSGETAHYRCDRVAICVGAHLNPRTIDLPGLDGFNGEVRHAVDYHGPEGLEGKRIVIVGAGESGVDIANELSSVACEAYLSIRGGKLVIPRINPLTNIANDYDTNRIRNAPPIVLRDWFMTLKRRLCFYTGDHTPETAVRAQLLEQSYAGPVSQTATKSDDFIHRVIEGKLGLRKNVVGFNGDNVIFEDGIHHPADVVIFAHGYVPSFPFLKYPEGVQGRHPGNLYLNMFHPELGDSLVFCGFARPTIGAIPPTGELQARLFAQVAAGKRVLPAQTTMARDILWVRKTNEESFPTQAQPNVVINWIPYMDKIASFIGCRPSPLYLLKRPRLLWNLSTGPVTGAHYRLQGPGASAISLETLMTLPRMHQISEILTYTGLHFWLWPLQIIHPKANWHTSNTIV